MRKRMLAGIVALAMAVSPLAGTNSVGPVEAEAAEITTGEATEKSAGEQEEDMSEEWKNSFSMMYYLAITAEEIRTSKDNRIALEDIYTSLLNDINPGAIDEITQDHLKNLRDIIKSYLEISTKRERLQFIYNQEKGAGIRLAVPNPAVLLGAVGTMDWRRLAMTVAYTALDMYKQSTDTGDAELSYIMSGWELDDEEKATVLKNRDRAFDYMVDMVQEYNLDGQKTLNEKSIEKFAEICSIENASEKIKLLEAEESKYSLLGNYWLELADAYFETSQYDKCLECVDQYDALATGIYRQDFNYLQILPEAIVAAQETYSGGKYVSEISAFAEAIMDNSNSDDWSMRYFVAQVYLDLYSRTNRRTFLENAYRITSENVTVLLKNQREINSAYLSPVVELTAEEPDYSYMTDAEKKTAKKNYKEEKKRVKEYNKAIKKARKTELPSLYEPLIVNCELLFALAEEIDLSADEKNVLEAILQTDEGEIFMVKPINASYSFADQGSEQEYSMEFTEDELIIPANMLTSESTIVVTVEENGNTETFEDLLVTKVEREGTTIDSFYAHVSSKTLKKYQWTTDSRITVEITYKDAYDKTCSFQFAVDSIVDKWFGDKVEFKQV